MLNGLHGRFTLDPRHQLLSELRRHSVRIFYRFCEALMGMVTNLLTLEPSKGSPRSLQTGFIHVGLDAVERMGRDLGAVAFT